MFCWMKSRKFYLGGGGVDIPIYRDIFGLSTTYVTILVLLMVKFVRACIIL